jgi:hypothetical protein
MVPVKVISLLWLFFQHLAFDPSQKFSEQHLLILQMFHPKHMAQTGRPLKSAPGGKKGCLDGEWKEELKLWYGRGEALHLEKGLEGEGQLGKQECDNCLK